jgi:hypothetical protein
VATYLFFDESGNLDFSANGSRFYFFGVLTACDPGPLTLAFSRLRYAMLEEGLELEGFHAAEDTHAVRARVFATLEEVGGFEVDVLVAEKRRLGADLHEPFEFYALLGHVLLEAVLRRLERTGERIVVVTDRLPLQRHRRAAEKAFKSAIRDTLGERPFSIVHHASAAHCGLQAADYCTWAVQRLWHRGDARAYERIRPWLRTVWVADDSGAPLRREAGGEGT